MKKILRQEISNKNLSDLQPLPPLLQHIYAIRGITNLKELDYNLKNLLPFDSLLGIDRATKCLFESLCKQQNILIIGDFDVDGATSTTLALCALKLFGFKNVSYLIPNRFEFGYGLSPEIVKIAAAKNPKKPDLIITVDNGISSFSGVELANELGINVLITDHHLASPNQPLPNAIAIVNPNQPNDNFPSKNLAGVGVIFYVMLALRSHLRAIKWFETNKISEPNMAQFLDLVALGTVADVVLLDHNNRLLVNAGLERIKSGNCRLAIKALLAAANKDYERIHAGDLGYIIAPRLNAAGRLDDMSLGIECLLGETKDLSKIRTIASSLNALNNERREIENTMQKQALNVLDKLQFNDTELPLGLCLYDDSWHQGVIGILASRLKDRFHRPTIAFAISDNQDEIKGSARSISGLHIRDVLDNIAANHPQLIIKFGGHAMAAGLTIKRDNYFLFKSIFETEINKHVSINTLQQCIYTDGDLLPEYFNIETADLLQKSGPWGQGFPEPIFDGYFEILDQHLVGKKHLKMILREVNSATEINAIYFNIDLNEWPNYRCKNIHAAFRLDVNEYNGRKSLQLLIEHLALA